MSKRGDWIVRMRCGVVKEVNCDNCTEEQARTDPWEYVVGDETEIEQYDWEVMSIEPNE